MSTAVVPWPTWVTITASAVNGLSPLITSATAQSSAANSTASAGGSRTVRARFTRHHAVGGVGGTGPGGVRPAPVIAAPSSSGVTVAGSAVATSRPRRITAMESDSPISSSRSALISSTARPAGPGPPQLLPDPGLRADVHPAGRVRRR